MSKIIVLRIHQVYETIQSFATSHSIIFIAQNSDNSFMKLIVQNSDNSFMKLRLKKCIFVLGVDVKPRPFRFLCERHIFSRTLLNSSINPKVAENLT